MPPASCRLCVCFSTRLPMGPSAGAPWAARPPQSWAGRVLPLAQQPSGLGGGWTGRPGSAAGQVSTWPRLCGDGRRSGQRDEASQFWLPAFRGPGAACAGGAGGTAHEDMLSRPPRVHPRLPCAQLAWDPPGLCGPSRSALIRHIQSSGPSDGPWPQDWRRPEARQCPPSSGREPARQLSHTDMLSLLLFSGTPSLSTSSSRPLRLEREHRGRRWASPPSQGWGHAELSTERPGLPLRG